MSDSLRECGDDSSHLACKVSGHAEIVGRTRQRQPAFPGSPGICHNATFVEKEQADLGTRVLVLNAFEVFSLQA